MESWVRQTSELLNLHIIPGEYFVLSRDLLIYPDRSFLACGLLGLVGSALYPRKRNVPFLEWALLLDGRLSPAVFQATDEYRGYSDRNEVVRRRVIHARGFLAAEFGVPRYSDDSGLGQKYAQEALDKGYLVDWRAFTS